MKFGSITDVARMRGVSKWLGHGQEGVMRQVIDES